MNVANIIIFRRIEGCVKSIGPERKIRGLVKNIAPQGADQPRRGATPATDGERESHHAKATDM
jgi:hypothetical protein